VSVRVPIRTTTTCAHAGSTGQHYVLGQYKMYFKYKNLLVRVIIFEVCTRVIFNYYFEVRTKQK